MRLISLLNNETCITSMVFLNDKTVWVADTSGHVSIWHMVHSPLLFSRSLSLALSAPLSLFGFFFFVRFCSDERGDTEKQFTWAFLLCWAFLVLLLLGYYIKENLIPTSHILQQIPKNMYIYIYIYIYLRIISIFV